MSDVKQYMCIRILLDDEETERPAHFRCVAAIDYDALAARLAEAARIIREYRDQRAIYNSAYDAATVARCNAWLAGAAVNEPGERNG